MAEFRTTFIPKAPVDASHTSGGSFGAGIPSQSVGTARKSGFGLITAVLLLLFFATLVMGAGVYAFEKSVDGQIAQLKDSLVRSQKAFEPKVILELKDLDNRLKIASTLLSKHVAVSSFFQMLGEQTLPGIAFDSFRFSSDPKQGLIITMTGRSTSYETIAEQSAVFGDDTRITQHVFSNFKLLDTGYIAFDLAVVPSGAGILYAEIVNTLQNQTTSTPLSSETQNTNGGQVVTMPVENTTATNPLFQTGGVQSTQTGSVIIQNVQ